MVSTGCVDVRLIRLGYHKFIKMHMRYTGKYIEDKANNRFLHTNEWEIFR
jgi:hypothetical protein